MTCHGVQPPQRSLPLAGFVCSRTLTHGTLVHTLGNDFVLVIQQALNVHRLGRLYLE